MRYLVACDNLEKVENSRTKIADVFNKSSRIKTWIRPMENVWVVQTKDNTTTPQDIRDMVRMASDTLRTWVTPLGKYAYSIASDRSEAYKAWDKKNAEAPATPAAPKPETAEKPVTDDKPAGKPPNPLNL